MKDKIKEFSKKLNIEYVGVAPVFCYEELGERLLERKRRYGISDFEEKNTEIRINPNALYPWAKSIIVCLFPDYTGEDSESNISRYARIPDYHKVAKDKLEKICNFIRETNNVQCETFADTGALCDRYLAYLAGLGFFGINNCLINEKYGTYFFIGYIITDMELECDVPLKKECKKCGKCIKNCPGKAIDEDYHMNVEKCISYITQLKTITDEQREILEKQNMIYGCDRCQEVCPHNEKPTKTPITEFYEKRQIKLLKEEIEGLSNRAFKEKYKDFPFSWRGKGVILKNFDNKP